MSKEADALAGFEVNCDFERFDARWDMFNRSFWDGSIRDERVEQFYASYFTDRAKFRKVDGFTHRDYALRNASWYIADVFSDLMLQDKDRMEGFLDTYTMLRPAATETYAVDDPKEMTKDIKRVGRYFGADTVGVCKFDERWVYTNIYSRRSAKSKPAELPTDLPYVVAIANRMDWNTIRTVPSALSGAATGQGYSVDIMAVLQLTQYIRNLGYTAVASLNDTALSIPIALQAGLGEFGRHSLLITPGFGPRVRIAKIFTDLPLVPDEPIHFGVREFCTICDRCAKACPPKAIPEGPPTFAAPTVSNLKGVKKWTVHPEKCFRFWANQGTDCSICIRVCPYNRDFSKWHNRMWRWLAGTSFRRLALKWHDVSRNSERKKSSWWWSGGEKR
ncbi:MAG TPA: reductive dehalogenase [Fimbriimonadaceae bacterium]|nr:reductive dehalogenase [Fimbriimonadaceae bacterium]